MYIYTYVIRSLEDESDSEFLYSVIIAVTVTALVLQTSPLRFTKK
jgi:hypothetical protein